MLTSLARTWGERIARPVACIMARLGLTPNAITALGFALTALVALVVAAGHLRLAGGLMIFTLGMDALDGTLARLTGASSRFGAFLDSTLDRWAEALLFGALVWHYTRIGYDTAVLLACAAMGASLLVSYTRARAEGVGLTCKEGLFTRFERLTLLVLGLIFDQTVPALAIIAALAAFTAAQRIWVTWRADQTTP